MTRIVLGVFSLQNDATAIQCWAIFFYINKAINYVPSLLDCRSSSLYMTERMIMLKTNICIAIFHRTKTSKLYCCAIVCVCRLFVYKAFYFITKLLLERCAGCYINSVFIVSCKLHNITNKTMQCPSLIHSFEVRNILRDVSCSFCMYVYELEWS